jgi:hypothetical protein
MVCVNIWSAACPRASEPTDAIHCQLRSAHDDWSARTVQVGRDLVPSAGDAHVRERAGGLVHARSLASHGPRLERLLLQHWRDRRVQRVHDTLEAHVVADVIGVLRGAVSSLMARNDR